MTQNLTIAIDDKLLHAAREVARSQGKSLNVLIRQYLEMLAGERGGAKETASELLDLMNKHGGHSRGKKYRREDLYRGRI